jgi:dynein intermediate chain 1
MPKKKGRKKRNEPEPEPEIDPDQPILVVPDDQIQGLDEKTLDEDHTCIMRANDPNKLNMGLALFNYEEQVYKPKPPNITDTLSVHIDRTYAFIMHRESDDAKAQLAMEAQIIEKEKEVLEELRAKLEEEGAAEGEEVEDSQALRNQFNFSNRVMQANAPGRKDAEEMTVPPVSVDFTGQVTQWEIWDWYSKNLREQENDLERKKDKGKKSKEPVEAKRLTIDTNESKKKDPMYSAEMLRSLKVVERVVNQNAFDDILMDFKFWEDASDKLRPGVGTCLPLWQFKSQKTGHRMVTGLCWNTTHRDLFAVSLGSYDFTRQSSGVVCVYSLKNPSSPDYVYQVDAGVMCIDFNNTTATSLLACGMYDGSVCVFDLGRKDPKTCGYDRDPVIMSTLETGKHYDPVWQIMWNKQEESSGTASFLSVGSDGVMMQWKLTTNELQVETLVTFKLVIKDDDALDETTTVGNANTTCFDYAPDSVDQFVAGSEEGDIYKCSTAYSTEYLLTYEGHDLCVYAVRYNCFHPKVFISCSADWTIKLWDHMQAKCLISWDLGQAVCDIAWAPFSSTVFAAVTADTRVHVYDLAVNRLEPLCEQRVVKKAKLTRIVFNPIEPVILVGDDKGAVVALKLSPNLRKLTECELHRNKKSGLINPPPEDPDELAKWRAEELEAEVDKLQKVLDRAIQAQATVPDL